MGPKLSRNSLTLYYLPLIFKISDVNMFHFITVSSILFHLSTAIDISDIDFNSISISGPSINSDVTLPYHYFFITFKDKHGNPIESSISNEGHPADPASFLTVYVNADGREFKSTIKSRGDGSYIAILNFRGFLNSVKIKIQSDSSVKTIDVKNLQTIECDCPDERFMFSDEYLTTMARMFKLPDLECMQTSATGLCLLKV